MIERKKKICKTCGNEDFIFGHGNCKKCYNKAYIQKTKVKLESKLNKDNKFFEYVWKTKPHYCQECGKELGEMKKWYMHHILPKSKYPYWRHDERNILMLCYQHHNEIESAISAPKLKVFALAESIKEKLFNEVGMHYNSRVEISD